MRTRTQRALLAGLAVAASTLLGLACGGGADAPDTGVTDPGGGPTTTTVDVAGGGTEADVSTVATLEADVATLYEAATGAAESGAIPRDPSYPTVFLVVDDTEAERVQVLLPTRPNGDTAWIARSDLDLDTVADRLVVDLSKHTLVHYVGADPVLEADVAVGQPGTPTPTGLFYVVELVEPADAAGPYGPFAFGLSAHSDVLDEFMGGDGQVGIHGTNRPDLLGTDASHGCVRVANDVIEHLAGELSLGTPVLIEP